MEKLNITTTEIERAIDFQLLAILKADLLTFKQKQAKDLKKQDLKAA